MAEPVLVALGGNALVKAGQRGTLEEQATNLKASLAAVVALIRRGHPVVITHGNGPQVGHILLRAEAARGLAYDLPLDVCVAQSQGELGYLIQQSLDDLLRRQGLDRPPVAAVLTRTVVDRLDPRMACPTKPVGPFYSKQEAETMKGRGYVVQEFPPHEYRRVVPSPLPLRVVESEVVRRLMEAGVVVIAVGGGGVPVAEEAGALVGVEAVVDKDLASGVLAAEIGIERILDLTAVDHVKLNFGAPHEKDLETLTVREARTYLAEGHFAPGSMGPKIEAAIRFLEQGGREVLITSQENALAALDGAGGTRIKPDG